MLQLWKLLYLLAPARAAVMAALPAHMLLFSTKQHMHLQARHCVKCPAVSVSCQSFLCMHPGITLAL